MIKSVLKDVPIVLGSKSPRRKELLASMDIVFEVVVFDTDETIDTSLPSEEIVLSIVRAKQVPFRNKVFEKKLVIVADTLVSDTEGNMLGKPKSTMDARLMLQQLSGKKHDVYTGVAVIFGNQEISFVEKTEVVFSKLENDEIDYYLRHYAPMDKAGAYGIQEWIGAIAVQHINGSYNNVVGLPTARLYKELKALLGNAH